MYQHIEGVCNDETDSVTLNDQPHRNVFTEQQYHPTAEKLRVKKTRHRRSESFGSTNITPRDSPSWDRKISRGEDLKHKQFCEAETQTEVFNDLSILTPSASRTPSAVRTPSITRTPSVAQTPRQSFSISSLNGNIIEVPCECP